MSTDDSDGSDEWENHFQKYYRKQWNLLDENLSPEHARLVKRVIKRGEEGGWATSTARNHMRNLRFLFEHSDKFGLSDDPKSWDAREWNELIDDLAIERDVGAGQKRAYARAAQAFIRLCRGVDSDMRLKIDSPKQERSKIDAESVLTQEEVLRIIEAAKNSRDRAIIAALYQGGFRREVISQLDIRHYVDNEEWAIIRVPHREGMKGASGHQKPLTWAKGFIDRWLSDHPDGRNPDAPLFCSLRPQDRGDRITGHAVYTMLQRLAKTPEVKEITDKPLNPHMFKHARATFMRASPRYDKKDIEQVMDWVESTPMHSRYSHADQPAEAARVAQKMGVDIGDENKDNPLDCPRCGGTITSGMSFCPHCSLLVSDEPPEWWPLFKSVSSDSDPIKQKYERVETVIPTLNQMRLAELQHIQNVFLLADNLRTNNTTNTISEPPYDNVKPFESEADADRAFTMTTRLNEIMADIYRVSPEDIDLISDSALIDLSNLNALTEEDGAGNDD